MDPVLQVRDLRVRFRSDFGDRIVTDDISYEVGEHEILGIVGESGCGKSVSNLAVMGLLPKNGSVLKGSAVFEGKDLLHLPEKELDQIRGKDIAMVFQDALASLDPVFTIESQLTESIRKHITKDKKKVRQMALDMLQKVAVPDPEETLKKYPGELSGGMRQRVMIAIALSCNPKLLIADEPTTALDVTIQAQIMKLIRNLTQELGMSMILITHDIGLIAQTADRVLVMYAGQIIEQADVFELFKNPLHPYTRALLASAPGIDDADNRTLVAIKGIVPENYTDLTGCRFMDRCPYAEEACRRHQELLEPVAGHPVRCFKAMEVKDSVE